jgi:hypothetical protein
LAKELSIPNFFIVGAAKAGTTSIYDYLGQHPDVYLSPIKEPNYFASDIDVTKFSKTFKNSIPNTKTYFKNIPLVNLQQAFIKEYSDYSKLFDGVNQQNIIAEASTSYLYSKSAAINIFDFNPSSKILIVLREPISRTYSHYLMALRFGFTHLPLIDAINKDLLTPKREIGQAELFTDMSMYAESVNRFKSIFPSSQIKVMFFENLVQSPIQFMNELCSFLEISSFIELSDAPKNTAELPKSKRLNKILTQLGVKKRIVGLLRDEAKQKLKRFTMSSKPLPLITATEKNFLRDILAADTQILKDQNKDLDFPW